MEVTPRTPEDRMREDVSALACLIAFYLEKWGERDGFEGERSLLYHINAYVTGRFPSTEKDRADDLAVIGKVIDHFGLKWAKSGGRQRKEEFVTKVLDYLAGQHKDITYCEGEGSNGN